MPAGNVLWNAAQAVNTDNPEQEDVIFFIANMIARKRDAIPDENKDKLMALIFNAGVSISHIDFDQRTLQFLDSQLGRVAVEQLVATAEGDWYVRECSCGVAPGYHISSKERIDRLREEGQEAEQLIRAILGDGDDAIGSIIGIGITRRRERTRTSKPN
jgi:hypothetical protein